MLLPSFSLTFTITLITELRRIMSSLRTLKLKMRMNNLMKMTLRSSRKKIITSTIFNFQSLRSWESSSRLMDLSAVPSFRSLLILFYLLLSAQAKSKRPSLASSSWTIWSSSWALTFLDLSTLKLPRKSFPTATLRLLLSDRPPLMVLVSWLRKLELTLPLFLTTAFRDLKSLLSSRCLLKLRRRNPR